MSESEPPTSQPPLLTYHKPVRYGYATTALVPMPWWLAAACTLAATWPLLITSTSPRGMGITVVHLGVVLYGPPMWLLAYGVGLLFVRPVAEPSREMELRAGRRVIYVLGLAVLLTALHATGVVSKAFFIVHYPLFEAERRRALAVMPPNSSAPHGWIGLFPIDKVHRGPDGEIGFGIHGDGYVHDPTPETKVWFFVPPDGGGPLTGGWEWVVTD